MIPNVLNQFQEINQFTIAGNIIYNCRKYHLRTTNKSVYPVHLAEDYRIRWLNETADDFDGDYRDHFFDFNKENASHRVRRADITTGIQPQRCVDGVRVWYRTNEAKILAEKRQGIPVRGFDE